MTSRKKRRSSLYAHHNEQFVEDLCQRVEQLATQIFEDDGPTEDDRNSLDVIKRSLRQRVRTPDLAFQRAEFLDIMSDADFRRRAPKSARLLYAFDMIIALVYADGESIIERLGCLLPKRERQLIIGDAIEAVRLQHSLSVGKPWPKFAVLATTAFWAGVIMKSAVLFAVFSHLPKRSR